MSTHQAAKSWLPNDKGILPVKCSVIIPTRHRPGLLRQTLDSLGRQTDKDFEVIVVVDGDDPQTRSVADTHRAPYPSRWIFQPEHKGQASARNAGAAMAKSAILLFLDDDTTPVPDWIYHHLKHHRTNSAQRDIVVFGKVIDNYLQPCRSRTEQYLRESRARDVALFEDRLKDLELNFSKVISFGLNASIPRKSFLALGGFDSTLNYIDEDADLGARLSNCGIQFKYDPDAIVFHNDTKDIINYHYSVARAGGKADVYRRREKKQCNGRLQLLAQMHCGSPLRKMVHHAAWYVPQVFQLTASLSRRATDLTGSRLSFRLWYRSAAAEYWNGLREAGETIGSLRDLYPKRTPILMLHSVSTPTKLNLRSYYISPERFKRYMGWLKRAGYTSTFPVNWNEHTTANRRVILTFDDAYDDFMSDAFPVLDHLGFKVTVFVVVDCIGKTNKWDETQGFQSRRLLTLEQIRELHRHGVHFGSHTLTHAWLTDLSDRDLEREVTDSKHKLEDLLGSEVPCFSYPWGAADMRVRAAITRAGYRVALSTQEGLNWSEDPLCLKRINLAEVDTLPEFAFKMLSGQDLRQRMKRYLIRKGLYREPGQSSPDKGSTGQDGEIMSSQESSHVVAPPVSNLDH